MILPTEVLSRISVFMDSPMSLALSNRHLYEQISSCQTKALWVKQKFPNYALSFKTSSIYTEEASKNRQLDVIIKEPLFFYLTRMDNLPISIWGEFAIERGFERSFTFLLKKYQLNTQDLINLTMASCIHGRLCMLNRLTDLILGDKTLIPVCSIYSTADQVLQEENGPVFQPFIVSSVILAMENFLPNESKCRAEFIGHCVEKSLHHGLICLKIISNSIFALCDLEIDWSSAVDEKAVDFLLRGLDISSKLLSLPEGCVNQSLLDAIIEKDFSICLRSLIVIGASLPWQHLMQLCTYSNSIKCFKLLLQQSDQNNSFSHFDYQDLMYISIQNDAAACLEEILKIVPSDQKSLQVAIENIGRVRTEQGQTCLDLLLKSNPQVIEAIEISHTALKSLGTFISDSV